MNPLNRKQNTVVLIVKTEKSSKKIEKVIILWAFYSTNKLKVIDMKTYIAVDQYGKTVHVSAYTETDARQKAEEALGFGNVKEFYEV